MKDGQAAVASDDQRFAVARLAAIRHLPDLTTPTGEP